MPKNVHQENNKERRAARAKALIEMHAQDGHARYVDAAEHQNEGYVAIAVKASTGAKTTTASLRCTDATDAEAILRLSAAP